MSYVPPVCPHELRPGTKVCLRCEHAARLAARARLRRIGGLSLAALATLIVIGALIASLLGRSRGDDVPSPVAATAGSSAEASAASPLAVAPDSAPATATRPATAPTLAPVLADGRTALRAGVVAERAGDSVVVQFDDVMERTRRPAKFEQLVRGTLPAIYGPAVAPLLAGWPDGSVARAGNLLTQLPTNGLRIPAGDGWTLVVYPRTRAGQDSALVVAYVARLIADR